MKFGKTAMRIGHGALALAGERGVFIQQQLSLQRRGQAD
jgi:hypothetical protein